MPKVILSILLLLLLVHPAAAEEDKIVQRFCFIGCNRVGFEVNTAINPSTANLQQLKNTFKEVAKAEPRPTHLFFIGDLILGYTSWLSTVDQLQAWKALYEESPLKGSGVTLVPVVGNHEMLLSVQDKRGNWHDYPNRPAAEAWKYVMRPLLRWRDGPTTAAPNEDSLVMSQEDLSFTVREGNILFICLNTDTFVDTTTTGDIPLHWLEEKLDQAEADESIEHVFVLAHKPLVKPDLDAWIIRDEEVQPALDLLNSHSKVRALLASHYHLWDVREMPGGLPQVIAGNGGSPLKGPFLEPGKGYYGYTYVDIMESGDVVVESWGRPVPEPYSSDAPQPPATLRERRMFKHR